MDFNKVPVKELTDYALSRPIEEIGEVCSTSNRLFRLCDSEMFWEERIKKDFPKYQPRTSLVSLTYKRYYQMLWKIWNLKENGQYIFRQLNTPIKQHGTRILNETGTISLIYPVPYFENEEGHIKPDISIMRTTFGRKKYILLGFFNRRTVTGDYVPVIGQNLDEWTLAEVTRVDPQAGLEMKDFIDNNISYEEGSSKKRKSYYDRYFFIEDTRKNVDALEEELAKVGYLRFPAEHIFENSTDLFVHRMFVQTSKPNLAQPKVASPKMASPPTSRNKIKSIFSFLNPSTKD